MCNRSEHWNATFTPTRSHVCFSLSLTTWQTVIISNFKAVFLRIVFRQMTGGTFYLSNDNSATKSLVVVLGTIGNPVFQVVPLFKKIIFQLIPDFDGAGHKCLLDLFTLKCPVCT